jgi:hypothetical protein
MTASEPSPTPHHRPTAGSRLASLLQRAHVGATQVAMTASEPSPTPHHRPTAGSRLASLLQRAHVASNGANVRKALPFRAGSHYNARSFRADSSAGRALRSQCRGREFDPPSVHQEFLAKTAHYVPLSIKWPPGHFMLDFPTGHILVYWVEHSRLAGFALRAGRKSSHSSECSLKKTGPFGPVFIFGGGLVRFRCAESL